MKTMRAKRRNQRGDTIIEVLIAVVIIGGILVGAFAVSQASSRAVQSSQEHAEMLQFMQAQVEHTRALALKESSATSGVFNPTTEVFCIDDSNPAAPAIVEIPFGGGVIPSVTSDSLSAYPAACKTGTNNRYHMAIEYFQVDNPALNQKAGVFHFTGRWERLGGGQKNNIELSYRIYPGATP